MAGFRLFLRDKTRDVFNSPLPGGDKEKLDELMQEILWELGHRLKRVDYTGVLEKQHQKLQDDHQAYFDAAEDANHEPWKPLKPRTIKAKGHATILIEYGHLNQSLTSRGGTAIRETTPTGLTFGTRDRKAKYHQHGTKRMPARPPVGVTQERVDALTNEVADFVVAELFG